MRTIMSRQNPLYRSLVAVAGEKGADARKSVLIEGYRLCTDAIDSRMPIEYLVFSDRFDSVKREQMIKMAPADTDVLCIPESMFEQLAATKNPQGVACVFQRPQRIRLSDTNLAGVRYLVLENVQDPGNVGTMVRTADAMGFDGVVVLPGTADPFGPKSIRSAMGSAFHVPVFDGTDIAETVRWLHEAGCRVYAGHLNGERLGGTGLVIPGAVIIGNEANGLSEEAAGLADALVRIPMRGRAESLNAACAAAILCYSMGMTQDTLKEGISCTPSS